MSVKFCVFHRILVMDKILAFHRTYFKLPLAIARLRLNALGLSICLSVCLSVCLSPEMRTQKRDFLKNYGVCLRPIGSTAWAFQRTHCLTPKIQDGGDPPS